MRVKDWSEFLEKLLTEPSAWKGSFKVLEDLTFEKSLLRYLN
jgi:hypothetical protein